MNQYSLPLLVLLLSTVSNCINIPCQAQTARETNSNISSQKNLFNDNTNERSPVNNVADSANTQSTILSENSENPNSVSEKKANLPPTFRIPIGSRIFIAPSMQQ